MKINFSADAQFDALLSRADVGCFVVFVSRAAIDEPTQISGDLATLNKLSNGALRRLFESKDFSASIGDVLLLPELTGIARRIALVGIGDDKVLNEMGYHRALHTVFARLLNLDMQHIAISLRDISVAAHPGSDWLLQQLVYCAEYANYQYTATRTPNPKKPFYPLKAMDILGVATSEHNNVLAQYGVAIATGCNTARELGNLPANICTPQYLADHAKTMAKNLDGLSVDILDEKKIESLKMGALLSVSVGSKQKPYVIELKYQSKNAAANKKPIVLVGKGVTFDTGGISLKPSSAMDEMKFDMCGAASVIGVVEAVARLGLPLNVIGIVGAVENMPSSVATKPGDVVTSMSGKTIEVLNTDAEGRMVLCDLLHYVKKYQPECIIDIATLTGACVVALGHQASAVYSNQQDLADALLSAGNHQTDRTWQMPLWPEYKKELRSPFADIANIGGRWAGSITAACFLQSFVDDDTPWAHLDIAGVAWHSGTTNKGATGRPVPLLTQYLIEYHSHS